MAEVPSTNPGMLSIREKRVIRYVILFVIVSRVLLVFRSEERTYTRPFLEDSFYLFNCAEHFAQGEGFTCDGKQPTNGVQPLLVLLYAPLFLIAGFNKLLAIKLAFILIAFLDSLSVIFIARLVRTLQKKPVEEDSLRKSPQVIAAILWAGLYSIFVHTGSGLETGLYSMLLLASLLYYAKLSRIRQDGGAIGFIKWVCFGIILGFAVLARIDAVFLVVLIACYELYKFKGKGFLNGAIISFFAFLVSSPWWYYNYKFFGSLMPQSGSAESLETGILAENIRRGAIVIGDILTVFFFLPNYKLPAWFHFFWLIAICGIVYWITKKFDLRKYLVETSERSSLAPFLLFCASLVVYYVFFFSAPHFLPRYFQPFRIFWLVITALVGPELIRRLGGMYDVNKLIKTAIWIFILGAIGFSASMYVYFYTVTYTSEFYRAGKYAFRHPNERIGMEQSGTAGFMAGNVVNLDGKVNFAALLANQKGDIGAYIESEKLDYLVDWREYSEAMVSSAAKHGGHFKWLDSIGRIQIYKRVK